MKFFSILFFVFLLISSAIADVEKFYLLPDEAPQAIRAITKELSHAKREVKISIYNFTHKKIANTLKYIAKRGVKVKIIFDFESSKKRKTKSQLYYLAKYKNIECYQIKGKPSKKHKYFGKMHQKMALIDGKTLILGSANWSYSGFGKNYEVVMIVKDKKIAKKYSDFFDSLLSKAAIF